MYKGDKRQHTGSEVKKNEWEKEGTSRKGGVSCPVANQRWSCDPVARGHEMAPKRMFTLILPNSNYA
jgi:hypothetical protein